MTEVSLILHVGHQLPHGQSDGKLQFPFTPCSCQNLLVASSNPNLPQEEQKEAFRAIVFLLTQCSKTYFLEMDKMHLHHI